MFIFLRTIIAILTLPLLFVAIFPLIGYLMLLRAKEGEPQAIAKADQIGERLKNNYVAFVKWKF